MTVKGLDISSQSEDINYIKLKNENIKFVMLRAGYTDYNNNKTKNKDPKFEENYKLAKKNKLKIGTYYCSRATTINEAQDEVNYFLNIIKNKEFEYPVVIQIEDDHNTIIYYPYSHETIDVHDLLDITTLILDNIKQSGYEPLIRTYESWYKSIFKEYKNDYYYWIDNVNNPDNTYKIYSNNNENLYSIIDLNSDEKDKIQIIISKICLIEKIKNYINTGYKFVKRKIGK